VTGFTVLSRLCRCQVWRKTYKTKYTKKKRNKRDKNNNESHKKRIQNNNKNRFARFTSMESRWRTRAELLGRGRGGQGKAKEQGRIDRLQLSVVLVMDAISHLWIMCRDKEMLIISNRAAGDIRSFAQIRFLVLILGSRITSHKNFLLWRFAIE